MSMVTLRWNHPSSRPRSPDGALTALAYPFRLGTEDPVAALEPGLDADRRRRLLRDNARAFLGLS